MNPSGNQNVDGGFVRHFREEEWIDYIDGSVGASKREQMARHLGACPRCRGLYEQWVPLLADPSGPERGPEWAGPASPGEAAAAALPVTAGPRPDLPAPLLPADNVRRSLRRRVLRIGLRRRLAAVRPLYRRGTAAVLAAAALAVLFAGLRNAGLGADNERTRYVSSYEPAALAVLSRPETVSYPLDWSRQDQFSGNVWYNERSHELFVLIEDVALRGDHSIQAWAVKGNRRDTLGLVQIEAAKGHLYVKDGGLAEADNIALTVEPAGGSSNPTSPDAVWVQLPRP